MGVTAQQRFADEVEPNLPALRAYVERRAPALADDVMQEVSVVAWRRLDEIPLGSERPWLFGVARMVLLAERRKATERQARLVDDERALLQVPATTGLSPDVAGPLAEALERLSERDRELLLFTAWEGLSTTETAEVLGIRPTAVRMGLVRARRRLAALLDDLDPDWTDRPIAPVSHDTTPPTDAEEAPPCDAARA